MGNDAPNSLQSLCVFCGSSNKVLPEYGALADSLAKELSKNKIRLIYGGASVGLMGRMADEVMAGGGEVYGFIPKDMAERSQFKDKDLEVVHTGITKLELVKDMHERKKKMYEMSEAFCALPGGIGTLEELAEVLTWNGLGYHGKIKPLVLLDDGKFWDFLFEMLDYMVAEEFLRPAWRAMVSRHTSAVEALEYIQQNLSAGSA